MRAVRPRAWVLPAVPAPRRVPRLRRKGRHGRRGHVARGRRFRLRPRRLRCHRGRFRVCFEVHQQPLHCWKRNRTEPVPPRLHREVLVVHVSGFRQNRGNAKHALVFLGNTNRVRSRVRRARHLRFQAQIHLPFVPRPELAVPVRRNHQLHDRFHVPRVHLVQILVLHVLHRER